VSTASSPSQARVFAAMTSALVQPYDVTDLLAALLQQTATALQAQAVGVLVMQGTGELELLASTSHAMSELEIYQAQTEEGPCVDAMRLVRPVTVIGKRELQSRWPTIGAAMTAAGFRTVHAEPLRWHGRALGGLNVFFTIDRELDDEAKALLTAFADITTLALVQTQAPSDRELQAHIRAALDARTLVEHAKGVLVQTQNLDPDEAYAVLRSLAGDQGLTVTEMARSLVWRAHSQ
jgi:transcriptional regulator with GAF, ATPase, and Fis domain